MSIATLVLAAGGSTRMGKPKLLLELRGVPLVRRAVQTACEAGLGPVVVIVGDERQQIEACVPDLGVTLVPNPGWAQGLGSSIHAGLDHIESDMGITAAIIMLADQPMVTVSLLARLAHEQQAARSDAAACLYGGTAGVPALFTRHLFSKLRQIPATGGAKHVLNDAGIRTVLIEFPEGLIDIDTPDDYARSTGST